MISFDAGHCEFNLRAAAIIVDQGRVLLHRQRGDDFWSFPGGRVEVSESGSFAVQREMQEEIGERISCGELLWVVENFFTYRGRAHHEIGLYFRAELASESRILNFQGPYEGIERDRRLSFDWFSTSQLSDIEIRPSFAAAELMAMRPGVRHLVHRENRFG
jgi:8-oxo-dGTP pyrophosphatase MutT (NUDIX family)